MAASEQFDGKPAPPIEAFAHETGLREQAPVRRGLDERRRFGDEQGEAARDAVGEVGRLEPVAALGRPPPGAGDELGKIAVARAIGREEHQAGIVLGPAAGGLPRPEVAQREFRTHQQGQAGGARLQVGAHDTGERTFIRDRERGVAERLRPVDEFFGMGGAAQEREVRDAVQLGVGGDHRE